DLAGCVALINEVTPGWRLGSPVVATVSQDRLAAADPFWAHSPPSAATAAAAELREVFAACEQGQPETAVASLNRMLGRFRPWPVFSTESGGHRLHFHAASDNPLENHLVAYVIALSNAITWQQWQRLGVCNAARCDRVYFDITKNSSKRFCSD